VSKITSEDLLAIGVKVNVDELTGGARRVIHLEGGEGLQSSRAIDIDWRSAIWTRPHALTDALATIGAFSATVTSDLRVAKGRARTIKVVLKARAFAV